MFLQTTETIHKSVMSDSSAISTVYAQQTRDVEAVLF